MGAEPLPPTIGNVRAAQITVKRTGKLKAGMGISILGNFLQAMGAKGAGLDTTFNKAGNLTFEFTDILEDHVDLTELDKFLSEADVNPRSTYVSELLESDGIYVITSVLKLKKFTVEAGASASGEGRLNADAIQGVVGAKVDVQRSSDGTNSVTFEGEEFLVFGFQAVRLIYREGQYTSIKPSPKAYMKGQLAPLAQRDLFTSQGVFARLGERAIS
jgi:hypothetical protein